MNSSCDNCGNDISPECDDAKQDGYNEGYNAAFSVISNMFREKKITRDSLKELSIEDARNLLSGIHYTVNY